MKLVDVIQEAKSSGDPGAISRAIPYANFIGIDAYLDGGTVICTLSSAGIWVYRMPQGALPEPGRVWVRAFRPPGRSRRCNEIGSNVGN